MHFGVSTCMWHVHLFKFQVTNVCTLQFTTLVTQIQILEKQMQYLQVFNLQMA